MDPKNLTMGNMGDREAVTGLSDMILFTGYLLFSAWHAGDYIKTLVSWLFSVCGWLMIGRIKSIKHWLLRWKARIISLKVSRPMFLQSRFGIDILCHHSKFGKKNYIWIYMSLRFFVGSDIQSLMWSTHNDSAGVHVRYITGHRSCAVLINVMRRPFW